MQYLVAEINGRQYLIEPGKTIEVDKLPTGSKEFSSEKVLLWVDEGKTEVGTPFLKKKINFERLEDIRKEKVRVSKYSAKSVSNRKVTGKVREVSRLKLVEMKRSCEN